MDAVFDKFKKSLSIGSAYGGFGGRGWVSVCANDITEDEFKHIREHPLTLEEARRQMGSIQGGVITKAKWTAIDRREVTLYNHDYGADLSLTVSSHPPRDEMELSPCAAAAEIAGIPNTMASFGDRLQEARERCYDELYDMFNAELDKAILAGRVGLTSLHFHVNHARHVAESIRDHPPPDDEIRARLGIKDNVPVELVAKIEDHEDGAPYILVTLTIHPVIRPKPTTRVMYKRVILVGEAAAGKDTIRDACRDLNVRCDVSVTTRRPREDETPGYTYDYLTEAEFLALRMADKFRESEKFNGNRYGTRRSTWDDPGLFILTPNKLGELTPEEQAESFVIYVTAPETVRAERMTARGLDAERIAERFAADSLLFENVDCEDVVWNGTEPPEIAAEFIRAILNGA